MIDTIIHRVHKAARDYPTAEFRARALDLLRDVISFDSASWGTACSDAVGMTPGNVQVYAQSSDVVRAYLGVRKYDTIGLRTMRKLGEPQTLSLDDRDDVSNGAFRAHCECFNYCNILSTMSDGARDTHYSFITLARSRRAGSFSAEHRDQMQRLVPHLLDAWVANCSWHIETNAGAQGGATAIAAPNGELMSRYPAFVSIFHAAYPGWQPPYLPASVMQAFASADHWIGPNVVIHATPVAGMLFLSAQPACPTQSLTSREVTIAKYAANGLSYKEIARLLSVSPSTVRNHLHQIYRKLDVTNKTALARIMQNTDWRHALS